MCSNGHMHVLHPSTNPFTYCSIQASISYQSSPIFLLHLPLFATRTFQFVVPLPLQRRQRRQPPALGPRRHCWVEEQPRHSRTLAPRLLPTRRACTLLPWAVTSDGPCVLVLLLWVLWLVVMGEGLPRILRVRRWVLVVMWVLLLLLWEPLVSCTGWRRWHSIWPTAARRQGWRRWGRRGRGPTINLRLGARCLPVLWPHGVWWPGRCLLPWL